MKADELKLEQFYKISSPFNQKDPLERIVSIPAAAIGMLKHELLETIGPERTKGFLLRYGWHTGVYDAEKVKELTWEDQREMLLAGPKMHTLHGYAEEVQNVKAEANFNNGSIYHEAIWKHSYEAEEHIKRYGYSDEPVCHTLIGYASGYLSNILGKKVIAKEIKCKAMGNEHCQVLCRTVEEWNEAIEQELKYYEEDSIIDELNETFRKLKIERDNLSKAYDVHQKLVEELLKESDLSGVANALYQHTHLPVLIESENLELLAVAGMSEEEGNLYSRQLGQLMNNKKKRDVNQLTQTKVLNDFDNYKRLITPIYLQKEVVAYCSFLYKDVKLQEVDKLILEQVALACSLYLFNERTRVQTELRMQGNLLDDILSNQMTFEEISKKAYYVGFQLNAPYFMISIGNNHQKLTIRDEIEFNDHLNKGISQFLKDRKINALLGQKSGKIMIFLSEGMMLKSGNSKKKFCQALHDYCSSKYPSHDFKSGISSSSARIEEASQLYDESNSALQIANHYQKVVFFEFLGIEGIIFQMKNDPLQKFIKRKLGTLIEEDKNKDMELIKTLFHYLNNGCNITKTARAINFSVTGLRYRLQKINELLETDINVPDVGHQIYLSLKLLIYWGEIDIDVGTSIDLNKEDRFNDFGND
ncbi:XylR N-terminal domain-containing protein [Bacillus sp. EB600]|uniref:XylR N-terminal domain-containing protein n=1 Tax=Bacillus sp. EB600 TaxID=2806345 RepID=UPI00210895A5|nr:XylR N-terminal domain-containing protein [Bacillus sp. EB600]MCQ6282380.1 XylR N-terminal domain-containing protein [Bacillus sp. EB600]